MSVTEPPLKKAKLDSNFALQNLDNYIQAVMEFSKPIKMIIADDLFIPVPSTNVYIGHIKNPSNISKAILVLNDKMPLKSLQHLKRVKGQDIILCPVNSLDGTSIEKYLEDNVPDLNDVFEYFKEVAVPSVPPKVKSQYKEANKMWSVNFHPDKYLESIYDNTIFTNAELKFHRQIMVLNFEIAKWYILKHKLQSDGVKDLNVALVLDPMVSSVVAVAVDNQTRHPMQHAAMLAIDNVAKTQNGGVWVSEDENNQTNRIHSGIDKELFLYLRKAFPDIKFGARQFEKRCRSVKSESSEKDIMSNGPYLCTGYSIYLIREPCVMCTMGLIHARINRAFFCFNNNDHGALTSRTMLHLNPSLNHRFEAFTEFL